MHEQYSPIIAPSSLKYVHHMLIYICSSLDQAEVGSSAPCFGHVGESVSECRLGTVMAAWAVGGTVSTMAQQCQQNNIFSTRSSYFFVELFI